MPQPHASNRVGMWLEVGSRANKIALLVGPSAAAAKVAPPAVSRRRGPSRNKPPASSVRDHNGQALAYVYYEDEPRALTRTSCNWWVSPFSRYKYPEINGEERPTVRQ